MSGTFINGQSGTITVGSVAYNVESWSFNAKAEALDTTNVGSQGFAENITGIISGEGSFKAYYDTSNPPTAQGGLNLRPGVSATFKLNIGNSATFWQFTARITQVTTENAAKGVVGFSGNFVSSGALTYPS